MSPRRWADVTRPRRTGEPLDGFEKACIAVLVVLSGLALYAGIDPRLW